MTSTSGVLLALTSILAFLDWVAVARNAARLEYVAKPLTTIALIAVALSLNVSQGASFAWRIAALVFCLLGDVFLMLPRDSFIQGLGSFAVAQVLFTISFVTGDTATSGFVIGVVIAVPIAVFLARRFVSAMRAAGQRNLVAPVIVYIAVISAMAVSAMSEGKAVAIIGAACFLLSDSLIAESRFVHMRQWHPVGIMVTYHVALAGLVLGLI